MESPFWEGLKAGLGSLWGNLKRWDNAEVAENYGNLRENGSGPITAAAAAFGASVGERAGVGMLEDARSGVSAEGERLGTGSRIWRGTLGLGIVALEALGIKGAGSGAKQALNKADEFFDSLRTGLGNLFRNKADDVVEEFPAPTQTRFIDDVTVVDHRTGTTLNGTVDLKSTLDRIESGVSYPHRNDGSIFRNAEGLLPEKPPGYYREYVHPTPGFDGPGPQRIIKGQGGELFYTPDHYDSFIPIN